MKICVRCHLPGDTASFYPNAIDLPDAWCKNCINKKRRRMVAKATKRADKLDREQAAIRAVVTQHQADGASFVYLLEGHNHTGYKIGFSKDVDARLKTFNTATGLPCKLIAVALGGREQEQALHRRFDCDRIAREWFAHKPIILQTFSKLPGAMVFLPGYVSEESPQSSVMDTPIIQ